jgi:glutaredoxin
MITVCLFTMSGCPHCKQLKERLQKERMEYVEYPIEDNQALWVQIVSELKHELLPTVFLKNDQNSSGIVLMPNITVQSEDEMIQKIKENT